MRLKLDIICSRHTLSKWINMYLEYIDKFCSPLSYLVCQSPIYIVS